MKPERTVILGLLILLVMGLGACTPAPAPTAAPAPTEPPAATQPPVVETVVVVVTSTTDPAAAAPTEAPTAAPAEPTPTVEAAAPAGGELGTAGNPVLNNTQWEIQTERFEGIEYALVPAGCFQMGYRDGFTEETPEHEVCFEEPFWIAVTETTNEQFGAAGSLAGDDYPRNDVTWSQAQSFCQSKGGRLPTEAEWEYAASGPSNLLYTMGDTLQPGFVIHAGSGGVNTVGSQPDGRSWVGALDMLGNVREWVSSAWENYPFDAEDGRERDPQNNETRRVIRGGGFTTGTANMRNTYREFNQFDASAGDIGFRCARDF